MEKTVCFTGHRPEKIITPYDENSNIIRNIKLHLKKHIIDLINQGYINFYSGMARGVDIYASEIILELRNSFKDIRHFAVVPYKNQADGWKKDWQNRYYSILKNSDVVLTLNDTYTKECLKERNDFMVENSDCILAVCNGKKSGTLYTIESAIKKNKKIILIEI